MELLVTWISRPHYRSIAMHCTPIAITQGERRTWVCSKCHREFPVPTRSPPTVECSRPNAIPSSIELIIENQSKKNRTGNVPLALCSRRGRLAKTIPAGILACGCQTIRLYECLFHDDLTTDQPCHADVAELLTRLEPTLRRNCATCQDRNRRKHPPAKNVVLSDTGLGDVTLNCWYPEAKLNVPANRVDVVRMFGGTLTTDPGENLAESWQPELRSREPRIDFRARWFGLTEIRRPPVHLDLAAVAWAKTLREPNKPLVVFAPQSHQNERQWVWTHWLALGATLAAQGYSVIMDLGRPDAALQAGPWRVFVGQSIQRLAALIAETDLVVAIDSGPAHVAGTIDRPTLLLLGPLSENSYEHMPSVQPIRSKRSCGPCNFQPPNYVPACFPACASLQELTPEAVAARAVRMLTPTNIGACTLADDRMADIRAVTRPPLEAYCGRHGYRLVTADATLCPARPASWSKILMLQRWLSDHDWLWWIDADAVVTAPERRLQELTDGATGDLLIARDHNGINSGSFLLRNCPWSHDFLRRVWETTEPHDHCWWEQWAIMQLLRNPDDMRHVQIVRKRSLNSYPDDWRPGDLVCHAPGVPNRLGVLREFLGR